jgi:hypothetical protein
MIIIIIHSFFVLLGFFLFAATARCVQDRCATVLRVPVDGQYGHRQGAGRSLGHVSRHYDRNHVRTCLKKIPVTLAIPHISSKQNCCQFNFAFFFLFFFSSEFFTTVENNSLFYAH